MSRARLAVLIGVGVAAAAVVAGVVFSGAFTDTTGTGGAGVVRPQGDTARAVAERFAAAWPAGRLSTVPFTTASRNAAGETTLIVAGLSTTDHDRPSSVTITRLQARPSASTTTTSTTAAVGSPTVPTTTTPGVGAAAADAVATLRVTWNLDATHTWSYDTLLPLVNEPRADLSNAWKVSWTPSVVVPGMVSGEALTTVRVAPLRGQIVDTAGNPLVGPRDVVNVGIQPSRTPDPVGTARAVAAIVGVDPVALVKLVQAAKPDQFVPVITLRREAYDAIRARIQPLPGTVFREDVQSLATSKDFAQALLGTVGPAPRSVADSSAGAIAVGEETGLAGLERSQNAVLAGTPGLRVVAVAPTPGVPSRLLKEYPSVPGRSITVTLDARIQTIADEIMATAPKPAALVAIRVSNGDVLAVSNGPSAAAGYDRALVGHYPPGSTFKVASGLTLLANGVTPDTPVLCPPTVTVGKVFKNAEGEVLGSVPFRTDFAKSCNTAFVGQSSRITSQQLTDMAGLLGYRPLTLGVPIFGGSVPVTSEITEHAANMIGQGKVEASPFTVALASASVANGHSLQPRLIVDPTQPTPAIGVGLPPVPVAELRDLMRRVVTSGTGTALLGVPGGDVAGKTGTAEFGTKNPPQTHAWFTGFQGDIAFAVLVEDGGFGGAVAAPLAAQFLSRLAG